MTEGQRKLTGVLTLPPLAYLLLFLTTPLGNIFSYNLTAPETPGWVLIATAFHFFMFLYSAFVFAFCMLHLLGDGRAGKTVKLLWGLLLVVGNVFVFPLYWFFRVRPAKEG